MGLSPKPNPQPIKKGWAELDQVLTNSFSNPISNPPFAVIFLNEYSLSKEEIIKEAEANGYVVTEEMSTVGPALRFV